MLKKVFLFSLPFALSISVFAQTSSDDFKIAFEKRSCKRCLEVANDKPAEVELTLINEEDGIIYLFVSDVNWFNQLFKRRRDGFVVDVISDDRYSCDNKNKNKNKKEALKGVLTTPMYKKQMKKVGVKSPEGDIYVPVGSFPSSVGKAHEMNLGILRKGFFGNEKLCKVITFYKAPTEKWDILEMDPLIDSANLSTDQKNAIKKSILEHKIDIVTFSIPFEQNKYNYKSSDIEPLLKKLMHANQKIKKINLKAYCSVEGSTEINKSLGNKRAASIVKAINELQEVDITPEIEVNENWDEFYSEIKGSSLARLASLDHAAVKMELRNRKIRHEAEPFLSKHRKAVVELELDALSKDKVSVEAIKKQYEIAITEKKLEDALLIQSEAFSGIRSEELPADVISSVNVPISTEYSSILLNQVLFDYETSSDNLEKGIAILQKLVDTDPSDVKIRYNLTVLQIKALAADKETVQIENITKNFDELKNSTVLDESLIRKLQLNIHVLLTDKYRKGNEEDLKSKSLDYVHTNYNSVTLSDKDYLSLAKYFSDYDKIDWTETILSLKANQAEADEELVFYYINRIIGSSDLMAKPVNQKILNKAATINQKRFCKLFNARNSGGISFQYLEDKNLKKVYCAHCK